MINDKIKPKKTVEVIKGTIEVDKPFRLTELEQKRTKEVIKGTITVDLKDNLKKSLKQAKTELQRQEAIKTKY